MLRQVRWALGLVAALSLSAAVGSAFGQEQGPAAELQPDEQALKALEKDWEEFRHYVRIGREEAARSFGQALAESAAEDRLMYRVSETMDADSLLSQAAGLSKELQEIAAKLRKRIDKGYEAERRDPNEIARQIERLGGTVTGYALASKRLQLSGEYALPQLVARLLDPGTSDELKERIVTVLPRLGQEAVRGLSVALQCGDPRVQEVVAIALGELGYPHAAPRLKELIERPDVLERVRKVARSALVACGGVVLADKPAAEQFYALAAKYYSRAESLRPDERYDTANVWYWQKDLGLTYKPVPREIFCDVYAMRNALLALKYDAEFYPAVTLWVSANLDKEANLPAGAEDPTRGEEQPSASFYALAGSAKFMQDVLAGALSDGNSAVAIGAIEALAKTAGARNLIEPVAGGSQPLVQALSHVDRQVRFLAAVSLANALPEERFEGSDQVIWVLAEALRQTGKRTVLLVASETDQRNVLKGAIRAAGHEVLDEPVAERALAAVRVLGRVDAVVVTDKPAGDEILSAMRREPLLAAMPVVAVSDSPRIVDMAARDNRLAVMSKEEAPVQMGEAIEKALLGGGKTMTAEEAAEWAILAAQAVGKLGRTGNRAFEVPAIVPSLIRATEHPQAEVRIAAAEALAALREAEAQQTIAKLANLADAEEEVRVASYRALSESLRRFGNQLTDELARGVLEVVKGTGSQELRLAAAQALGAMNLPSRSITTLFLDTAGVE